MTPAPNEPAQTLPGYTLGRPIAEGGMAEVYVATQHSLGRKVAVKIMRAGDASLADRFQREARMVATLNHSHIVHIYDVGQLDDGRPYFSMELLPGGDLRQRIRDGLRGNEVLRILRQLAEGLRAVHERGIVHRDIKPANVLFRENGDAVLTDFGIAKATNVDVELTHAGLVVGSPAYSSPEQIGTKPLDARSDLYSLGVVLVEMLLGRNPFRGSDYAATVVNQVQLPPPVLPAWHEAWQPIVDRLLAKKPDDRYSSAAALLDDIAVLNVEQQRALADTDSTTTRFHTALRLPLPISRRRLRRLRLAGALALALMAALALGWLTLRPDPQIGRWLARAEERMSDGRLSAPAHDSAASYYRQVLAHDPENVDAKEGLLLLARRHAEQAQQAHARGDLERALEHVTYGLMVAPDDPSLKLLKQEMPAAMARRFGTEALQARATGDLAAAQVKVEQGLALQPDDAALLTLRADIRQTLAERERERAEREKAAARRVATAAAAAPAPAPEKKGFFSRLFGR
jgi:hypothetical protein